MDCSGSGVSQQRLLQGGVQVGWVVATDTQLSVAAAGLGKVCCFQPRAPHLQVSCHLASPAVHGLGPTVLAARLVHKVLRGGVWVHVVASGGLWRATVSAR